MNDQTVRTALQRHWDASDANEFDVEHEIYREDAVLDYPQSGKQITAGATFRRANSSSRTRSALRSGE